eukprot:7634112-Ditylum_brightwellii.AAC.1
MEGENVTSRRTKVICKNYVPPNGKINKQHMMKIHKDSLEQVEDQGKDIFIAKEMAKTEILYDNLKGRAHSFVLKTTTNRIHHLYIHHGTQNKFTCIYINKTLNTTNKAEEDHRKQKAGQWDEKFLKWVSKEDGTSIHNSFNTARKDVLTKEKQIQEQTKEDLIDK